MNEKIEKIIERFVLPQGSMEAAPYGNGHINDTLRVIVHMQFPAYFPYYYISKSSSWSIFSNCELYKSA